MLVLGILSLIMPIIGLVLGIIGVVLGKQSMKEIDKNGEGGRGMAVAGFVCGIVGLSIWGLYFLFGILGIMAFLSFDNSFTILFLG